MQYVINTLGSRICIKMVDNVMCRGHIKVNANRMFCSKCGTYAEFHHGIIPVQTVGEDIPVRRLH